MISADELFKQFTETFNNLSEDEQKQAIMQAGFCKNNTEAYASWAKQRQEYVRAQVVSRAIKKRHTQSAKGVEVCSK